MRLMPTSCLPSCSCSWPGPWPRTSADGENTLKYSYGSSNTAPSSKRISSSRDRVRDLMARGCGMSEDVPGEVLVLHQLAEVLIHIVLGDAHFGAALVGGFVGQRFQQSFQHGVQ